MPGWRSFSQLVCMSLCWIFEIIWMCLARVIERSYRGFTVAYRPVRLLAAVKVMPEYAWIGIKSATSLHRNLLSYLCWLWLLWQTYAFFFRHVGSSSLSPGFQISWTRRPVSGDDAAAKQGIHQDPLWPGGGWKLRNLGISYRIITNKSILYRLIINRLLNMILWERAVLVNHGEANLHRPASGKSLKVFTARKTQKKRGRKLLLGSKVSEDRQLAPQFVILVVRLSKENNNNPSEVMPCQSWPDFIRTSRLIASASNFF